MKLLGPLRPLLPVLAIAFGAATTLYSIIWMVHIRHPGDLSVFERWTAAHEVELRVDKGSPAWQAGLRPGDRLIAINGEKLADPSPFYGYPFYKYIMLGHQEDRVQLTVVRSGAPNNLTLRLALRSLTEASSRVSGLRVVALRSINFYPLLFLIVGLNVLILRLEDRNAWLLALLFAGFISDAPLVEGALNPHLRGFAAFYMVTFSALSPGIFCYFFLSFPAPSPIDRRVPRLKSVLLAASAVYSIPLGIACLLAGGLYPLHFVFGFVSKKPLAWVFIIYALSFYALGFVSLVWNSVRPATVEARRKTRVIVWGTLVGFGPVFVIFASSFVTGFPVYRLPFWIWTLAIISLALMPLSFAYAVVKHRVLEIPVLLKRSARYLLVQRGFVVLQVVLGTVVTIVFTLTLTRFFQSWAQFALPAGLTAGVAFGTGLAIAGIRIHQGVTRRIDRAFFRSAYDARQILENLAEKSRTATTRQELAALLEKEIGEALHPTFMGVYLEADDGRLSLQDGGGRSELEQTLSAGAPRLRDLARRGEPGEARPSLAGGSSPWLPLFARVQPECVVPMLGRGRQLAGLLALGPRLSEEPYSREDKRLLASVSSQAGVTLENIRLAEQMAERIDAERRAAREMEFAREVQARLFPQKQPALERLEYAGACIQARQVGGDYYDFLDLGPGRLGLVLADIAGKGISGALLMANLQANLRSQYAVALDDMRRLLQSVNRLFHQNTGPSDYATLFFAEYDDRTGRLRYANCGHLSPLVLRTRQSIWAASVASAELADPGDPRPACEESSVERLVSTCPVVGLFEDWECRVEEIVLAPGDTLVIYSDGVTEAGSDDGEEFGESRLLEALCAHRHLPVPSLLQAIVTAVSNFSGREQEDDITLVVARRNN